MELCASAARVEFLVAPRAEGDDANALMTVEAVASVEDPLSKLDDPDDGDIVGETDAAETSVLRNWEVSVPVDVRSEDVLVGCLIEGRENGLSSSSSSSSPSPRPSSVPVSSEVLSESAGIATAEDVDFVDSTVVACVAAFDLSDDSFNRVGP